MNRGFVKIYRRIEDNALWEDDEPYCKRAAWIDLVMTANHKDNSFLLGMQKMNIRRGQKWTSSAKLAEKWHWSRKKVMAYLHLLEREGMIYLEITNKGLLVTIVNYCVYQDFSRGGGTANVTADGTADAHQTSQQPLQQPSQQMHTNKNVKNDIKNDIKNEEKNVKKPAALSVDFVVED